MGQDDFIVLSSNLGDIVVSIAPDTFNDLTSTIYLEISKQKIFQLAENLFEYTTKVENLRLHENNIVEIHPNTFSTLKNLRMLHMNDNLLESIPENLFQNNKELEVIYMHKNRLQTVHSNTMVNLLDLRILSFSFNYIDNIDFSHNKNLTVINLFNNNLTEIPKITRENFPKLNRIAITGNFFNCSYAKRIVKELLALKIEINEFEMSEDGQYTDATFQKFVKHTCVSKRLFDVQRLRNRINLIRSKLESHVENLEIKEQLNQIKEESDIIHQSEFDNSTLKSMDDEYDLLKNETTPENKSENLNYLNDISVSVIRIPNKQSPEPPRTSETIQVINSHFLV